jgi:ribosomal protein S25
LKKVVDEKIISLWSKAERVSVIIKYMYSNPIISSRIVVEKLNVVSTTANTLLKSLVSLWILKEITGHRKNKLYSFEEYLKIFR